MKISHVILSFTFLFFACTEEKPSYSEIIKSKRTFKDIQFKQDDSPIPKDVRRAFEGLNYYEPDTSFKVVANVVWDFNVQETLLYKSAREDSKHFPVASLSFVLKGESFSLTGFSDKLSVPEVLFIPFYDQTSGDETYGGGRYVDVKMKSKDQVEIDFNMAYNPYCVYNSNYVCAIPPFENDLKIKVFAGEKMPFIEEPKH